ncbi:MAG: hypothetical protein PF485_12470 [Bacteroidales bacterium]|jgi:hypothetical protein|nr:hypothetical protein [Bacteroidales bacterium]
MKESFNRQMFLFFIAILVSLNYSCSNKTVETYEKVMTVASCEGCHINYAHLQEVYSPDTVAPAGGCGGEAPHYEPYDRVYLGGEGYIDFKNSGHYAMGCIACHNGSDNTSDKNVAHSGDFISHPSMYYEEKCGTCHSEIADNFITSIHNGTGQKRKVTMRSGLSGAEDFDQLPAHQIEGYTTNCATCHGTCGNCHIVRPAIAGGGLSNGHAFNKEPDMRKVCTACHVSRGGHAYFGEAIGTVPDVHLTNNSYTCMNCHSGAELHGDGNPVDQRYAYTELPTCENCHPDISTANNYHSVHYDDFNCQVCHSQDYNNCGSCHIHGEGARVPAYLGFKIASNPIPDIKSGFEFVLVRRTLAAPDNWIEYGETYSNFDVFPTYNYTTPHNILKHTSRTLVDDGADCYSNCHIRKEGEVLINNELYLFQEDLLDWEISATSGITVDGKLPDSWTN